MEYSSLTPQDIACTKWCSITFSLTHRRAAVKVNFASSMRHSTFHWLRLWKRFLRRLFFSSPLSIVITSDDSFPRRVDGPLKTSREYDPAGAACISGTVYSRVFTPIPTNIFLRNTRPRIFTNTPPRTGSTSAGWASPRWQRVTYFDGSLRFPRDKWCTGHPPRRLDLLLHYAQRTFVRESAWSCEI